MTPNRPVLIVEEDDDLRNMLRLALEQMLGAPVVVAENGEQAIRRANIVRPAAILLNLRLPDMDGISVVRRLKSSAATLSVPVIGMTAAPKMIPAAIEAGCVECYGIPFRSLQDIAASVAKYIALGTRTLLN
jgi:CheY-like chemotaxis protein